MISCVYYTSYWCIENTLYMREGCVVIIASKITCLIENKSTWRDCTMHWKRTTAVSLPAVDPKLHWFTSNFIGSIFDLFGSTFDLIGSTLAVCRNSHQSATLFLVLNTSNHSLTHTTHLCGLFKNFCQYSCLLGLIFIVAINATNHLLHLTFKSLALPEHFAFHWTWTCRLFTKLHRNIWACDSRHIVMQY